MKILMRVIGGLFVLMGLVWMGQGLKVIPGTFMSGDLAWFGWGALEAALGALLLGVSGRIGAPTRRSSVSR